MKLSTKIIKVLEKVFPNQKTFNSLMSKDDIDDWDSMNHLILIVELEDNFSIKFTKEEIENLNSIEMIIKKIDEK